MATVARKLTALLCAMMLITSLPAHAEKAGTSTSSSGPRRQIATIIFAGLGGAILGLSTLSFYSRPQDKLGNIALGFALGIIVGTGFVTYRAASSPSEGFSQYQLEADPSLARAAGSDEIAREIMIESLKRQPTFLTADWRPPMMSWSWTF